MPLTERRLRGNVSSAHGCSLFGALGDEHATDETSLARARLWRARRLFGGERTLSAGSATRMPLTERRLRGHVSGAHGGLLFGGERKRSADRRVRRRPCD
jgi:hypothetical protein